MSQLAFSFDYRRVAEQLAFSFARKKPDLARDQLVKKLRGMILSHMGAVFIGGVKLRVHCPNCRHRGIVCYNPRTGLCAWACGNCDLFEGGFYPFGKKGVAA